MAEKKSFWTGLHGLITGLAALITGLVALVSLVGRGGNNTTATTGSSPPPAAASSPSPGATGATATATPSGSDTSSPGSGAAGPTGSPGTPGSPGSPATLTANPASLDLGTVGINQQSSVQTVTITNAGGSPATITTVNPDGADSPWFQVASSTCGIGATLQPGASCSVGIRATAQQVRGAAASLDIAYQAGTAQTLSVPLSVTGSLL
ncbi:MAG TPA: choice-of-anchor D domain-containing protein [Actinomycetota bacterium]|nr:choice-of-anchor D domain-containing protein [Actinomycetota bacterium]